MRIGRASSATSGAAAPACAVTVRLFPRRFSAKNVMSGSHTIICRRMDGVSMLRSGVPMSTPSSASLPMTALSLSDGEMSVRISHTRVPTRYAMTQNAASPASSAVRGSRCASTKGTPRRSRM